MFYWNRNYYFIFIGHKVNGVSTLKDKQRLRIYGINLNISAIAIQ